MADGLAKIRYSFAKQKQVHGADVKSDEWSKHAWTTLRQPLVVHSFYHRHLQRVPATPDALKGTSKNPPFSKSVCVRPSLCLYVTLRLNLDQWTSPFVSRLAEMPHFEAFAQGALFRQLRRWSFLFHLHNKGCRTAPTSPGRRTPSLAVPRCFNGFQPDIVVRAPPDEHVGISWSLDRLFGISRSGLTATCAQPPVERPSPPARVSAGDSTLQLSQCKDLRFIQRPF